MVSRELPAQRWPLEGAPPTMARRIGMAAQATRPQLGHGGAGFHGGGCCGGGGQAAPSAPSGGGGGAPSGGGGGQVIAER